MKAVVLLFSLLLTRTRALFTVKEFSIIDDLTNYFLPAYLDLLADIVTDDLPSFVANSSFPPRKLIMTSVVNPQGLLRNSRRDRAERGALSMVVAKDGTKAWERFLEMADFQAMPNVKWVVLTISPSPTFLKSIMIPFDCQFLVVNTAGSIKIITEFYHIVRGGQLKTAHFGYWAEETGLVGPSTDFYRRRSNLAGNTFSAIIKSIPPYTFVTKHRNGTTSMGGYFYEVWKELEYRLNFKTDFKVLNRNDKIWPELKKGNVSFLVSPIWQDSGLALEVGLTEPIYEPKIHLFGRRPGSELEWNSYLKPFSMQTWFAMLGWLFGSAIALKILYFVAWQKNIAERDAGYYAFSLSVCLETTFRAAVGQGSDTVPNSLSCRVLFLSIYMTALVLMSAFSAALFSLLTVPVPREPFVSFKQLHETSNFKMGIIPDSDVHAGIRDLAGRHPDWDRSKLLRILEPAADLPGNVVQALDRICNRGDYVFMWDLPNVQLRIPELPRLCQERIMKGGPMLFNEFLSFATALRSPYKGIINLHLIRMKNEGVINRLLVNTWPARMPNVPGTWVRVTVDDISPILYMFALGVVLGLTFLFMENLHWQAKKKTPKKTTFPTSTGLKAAYQGDFNYENSSQTRRHWRQLNTDLHYRYNNTKSRYMN